MDLALAQLPSATHNRPEQRPLGIGSDPRVVEIGVRVGIERVMTWHRKCRAEEVVRRTRAGCAGCGSPT